MSRRNTTKVLNNSYNAVDRETGTTSAITISPFVSHLYQESVSDDISDLYQSKITDEMMYDLFLESPFYDKYKNSTKKIEKGDAYEIYIYFRDLLMEKMPSINIIQIFFAIMEFFEFNYDKMYNDIISINDRSKILEVLENVYGYKSELSCNKLF
jgi:esterase/lipase superfamily enzyme